MYYFISYREDVTGISEGKVVAGKFETLEEATDYSKAHPQKFQADSPYFIHLAQLREDGHFYFLGDNQIIYITI